ncbi:MAG: nucleotidyltransferase domain-containing protein [Bacteroidetes bacterium]|nr:nucleotidyltransferase domain-containing protein [Bacteroidota bacterium]
MKTTLEHIPSNVVNLVSNIKNKILEKRGDINVEYIILFGSLSKGKITRDVYTGYRSDIDILILTKYTKEADKEKPF